MILVPIEHYLIFTTSKHRSESTVQAFHWRIFAVLTKMIHPAVSWYVGVRCRWYLVKFTNDLTLRIVANCNKCANEPIWHLGTPRCATQYSLRSWSGEIYRIAAAL